MKDYEYRSLSVVQAQHVYPNMYIVCSVAESGPVLVRKVVRVDCSEAGVEIQVQAEPPLPLYVFKPTDLVMITTRYF